MRFDSISSGFEHTETTCEYYERDPMKKMRSENTPSPPPKSTYPKNTHISHLRTIWESSLFNLLNCSIRKV